MLRFLTLLLALLLLAAPSAILPAQAPAPQPHTQPKEQTVYITKTGKKYHRAGCRSLSKSKIPVSPQGCESQWLHGLQCLPAAAVIPKKPTTGHFAKRLSLRAAPTR